MTSQFPNVADLVTDLKVALSFSTRLPLTQGSTVAGSDLARAVWALPIAGACVGLFGALAYWLVARAGLPPLPAAALSIAATTLATGCLHEDGLADVADGFGGGTTRERKLEIMRDSRLGTYGAMILLVSFAAKLSALAAIPDGYVVP
ncbi:MAG: adenosylcobinamide-GDP ribazoletransferase, partial [Xanthobacteraceae bacterium]